MRGGVHQNRQPLEMIHADGRGVVLAFRAAMETSATSQVSGAIVDVGRLQDATARHAPVQETS